MDGKLLITVLRTNGHTITLSPDGERILVRPMPGAELPADDIRAHRDDLVGHLRGETFQAALLATIDQIARIWPRGWEPTLECEMVQDELDIAAANVEVDYPGAMAALQKWEAVWVRAIRETNRR